MDIDVNLRVNARATLTTFQDGTGVLLHLDSMFYFTLNETALDIWRWIESGAATSVRTLSARLCETYEVESDRATKDVDHLVNQLWENELLVIVTPPGG